MIQPEDTWGSDPGVQKIRKMFSAIENRTKEIMDQLDISPYDSRLRDIRESTLKNFHILCSKLTKNFRSLKTEDYVNAYVFSLIDELQSAGINIPNALVSNNRSDLKMFNEEIK